ncbi:MAG: hypothetical protein QME66_10290 [Candidatus Eisenbacteria bacterium]|nr:hypothetical protein [Candidatus Eisenbacteria bacterium]
MRKVLLLLVLTIMLLSAIAPMVQAFGGAYCEEAAGAHWMSWGLNVRCLMEVAIDAAFDLLRAGAGWFGD